MSEHLLAQVQAADYLKAHEIMFNLRSTFLMQV